MGSRQLALPLFLAVVASSCVGPARPEFRAAHQWEPSGVVADGTAETAQGLVVDERSKVITARNALAQLKMLTEGAQALSDGDPVTAEDLLGAFLQFEPDNAMALFLHGVALLDLGRTAEARLELRASTEADPESASGFSVLARIEFELGDVDASITALRQATLCAPEEAQHWVSLGLLYVESDRWNEAYDALLKAVECDPSDVVAHRELGRLYLSVGEYSLAERAFRTALGLEPEDVGLRVALAHILRDLGRSAEALAMYKEAAESEVNNPWLHANIASTLMELRKPHAARPHFETALSQLTESGMDSALVYLNYGSMLEGLGDLDGAVVAYESAVEVAPQMAEAHETLGVLQLNLGYSAKAQKHLIAADSLGGAAPGHPSRTGSASRGRQRLGRSPHVFASFAGEFAKQRAG